MSERQIIHFVEPDQRQRADLARVAFGLGYHAEVYAGLAELAGHPPQRGVVAVRDGPPMKGVADTLDFLSRAGIWLPLIMIDVAPSIARAVDAIKAGALDYLALPLDPERLRELLSGLDEETRAHTEARRRMIEARGRIEVLSARERQVLDWLAQGCSNKAIARELAISPRTVEIHRANMMAKLGASHSAEAVRLRIEAQLDGVAQVR